MSASYLFALNKLQQIGSNNKEIYMNADPFPHIVMDHFFDESILNSVLNEFPDLSSDRWKSYKHAYSEKLANSSEEQLGELTRELIYQLNSSPFLRFLEQITGIEGLIPDPHLVGGGLHQIERGGFLKIHADFNFHKTLKLDRRINLLVYLNKDWKEEYGGHLELWDKDLKGCKKKIAPLFNRVVLFNTTDTAFHGHPEPLQCPEGRRRRSIAMYYYSNGRPVAEKSEAHSTLYKEKMEKDAVFKKAMGASFVKQRVRSLISKIKSITSQV